MADRSQPKALNPVLSGKWNLWSDLRWLGILPFILAISAAIVLYPNADRISNPVLLISVLNTVFVAFPSLIIAYLMAMGFLRTGQHALALLGGGIFSMAFVGITNWLPDANSKVTMATFMVLFASLAEATSVLLYRKGSAIRDRAERKYYLSTIYGAGFLLAGAVYLLAFNDIIPHFLDPQNGSAVIKHSLNFISAGLFAVAGGYYLFHFHGSRNSFYFWISLGMLMAALAYTINGLSLSPVTVYPWVARLSIYTSGFYWLIATFVLVQNRNRQKPIEQIIAEFGKHANINYEGLINSATDAIVAVDELGRILTWNPAAEKMFGYFQQEVIGSPFFHLLNDPDQITAYEEASSRVDPSSGSRHHSATLDIKAKRKSGQEFPASLTLASRSVIGGWFLATEATTTTTTLVIRDITEIKNQEHALRESEERYRTLFNEMRLPKKPALKQSMYCPALPDSEKDG